VTSYRRKLRWNGAVSRQLGNALFGIGTVVEMDSHQNRMLAAAVMTMSKNLVGRHRLSSITATRLFQNLIFPEVDKSALVAARRARCIGSQILIRARGFVQSLSCRWILCRKNPPHISSLEGKFIALEDSAATVSGCFHSRPFLACNLCLPCTGSQRAVWHVP